MIKVIIFAIILINTCSQQTTQYIGQAFSIIALGLSIPHSFFFKQHIRILNLLQTAYLVTSVNANNITNYINYSVIYFMPSFISDESQLLRQCGGSFSFGLIVVCLGILSYIIYKIQKLRIRSLNYDGVWFLIQSFIDWFYLILTNIIIRQLILRIKTNIESGNLGPIKQLIIIITMFIICMIYPIVVFSVKIKKINQQDYNKNSIYSEVIFFTRIIITILFVNLANFVYYQIVYIIYFILVTYTAFNFWYYKFINKFQRIIFLIGESFLIIILSISIFGNVNVIKIEIYLIIAIFVIQFLFQMYKYYKFVLFRKKRVMIYPQKMNEQIIQKHIIVKSKRNINQNRQLDSTQIIMDDAVLNSGNIKIQQKNGNNKGELIILN